MKNLKVKKICNKALDYYLDRMCILCEEGRSKDAQSLHSEIRDWIIQKENLEILSLEYISGYFTDL